MAAPQARKVVHPDIKPANKPELASHYLDVPNMPWEPTKFAGIRIKVLYSDDSGITTALFRLDPGAVVPLHEHTALEQTYVLEGTLEDHEGVCGPGQFVWRPAGNQDEAVAPLSATVRQLTEYFTGTRRDGSRRIVSDDYRHIDRRRWRTTGRRRGIRRRR